MDLKGIFCFTFIEMIDRGNVGIENNLFCGLKNPSFRPEAGMHVNQEYTRE